MHIKGQSRDQATLFPERLDELISEDNPVRVIDAFIDALELKARLEQVDRQISEWLVALERADGKVPTTVTDEAGHTRTALAALEIEREGLTARIAQMQVQDLRAQPNTDGDARPMKRFIGLTCH